MFSLLIITYGDWVAGYSEIQGSTSLLATWVPVQYLVPYLLLTLFRNTYGTNDSKLSDVDPKFMGFRILSVENRFRMINSLKCQFL